MPDATTSSWMTGSWPYDGFPSQVRLRGRMFHKVGWVGTTYDGVIARYREVGSAVATRIVVLDTGTYKVEGSRPVPLEPVAPVKSEAARVPWTRVALGLVGVLVGAGLLAVLRGRGGEG